MKKPIHKIAFLFGLYVALHFVAACDPGCNCSDVEFPFFDYQSLTITSNDPIQESELHLDVVPAEISLLAAVGQPFNAFNLINAAWGCDCTGNGDDGPKFPIVALNIFADRIFDTLHPIDSSLTSLFTFSQYESRTNQEYALIKPAIDNINWSLRLTTSNQPQHPDLPIRFTLQFIKSNNDTVSI
ncbi:MAG: hypothetical protein LH618_14835, partial [Saprospiraceae bacterium]|nr:hypothetical protein [Saprospiraceae bacterium]